MDNKRLILFVIFSFTILMLWDSWQRQHMPAPTPETALSAPANSAVPSAGSATPDAATPSAEPSFSLQKGQRVNVETDVYKVEFDTTGADIRQLTLLQHRDDDDTQKNFVLLDDTSKSMTYVAQTGLKGADLPTHRELFTTAQTSYQMASGADTLEVKFSATPKNGVSVDKVYTFHRGSYVIDVRYDIKNESANAITPSVYYQIIHDSESRQGSAMMPTFTGGAYYTEAAKFNKLAFKDMEKEPLSKETKDGWIGLVQHYFVSAWIQDTGVSRKFYTNQLTDKLYSIGSISPMATIAAGASATVKARYYAGPQTQKDLVATAPGLDLVVDYGKLTFIASPLFVVLSKIHDFVKNWGVSIIILTIMIKAAFYWFSATSYRSMARMREVAPKMQALKEKFGEDRQKMQQAMMELYKTEKINPMTGCLPILIQIPVFIALYWMLLGTVEMRHAPFFGWIQDLSAKDPFYILPILMGASMIIQTKLNPPATDPVQQKVMQIMPIMMSIFFFWFPAGLVLYWLVNNILSIAQQWYINKTIHAETLARQSGKKRG